MMYLYYGDKSVLLKHYDGLKRYIQYLSDCSPDGIPSCAKYGDWCPPGGIFPKYTPKELVAAAYYYRDVVTLAGIASMLGYGGDCEGYLEQADFIKVSFIRCFLKDGFYGANDQTSNVLALAFGLVPEELKKRVAESLARDVIYMKDCHFDTGILGTKYILGVLCDCGYKEAAFKMITRESYPGYGYMIREGATTVWEHWEKLTSRGMSSQNNAMFCSVDEWFYKYLGGIRNDGVCWDKILIRPYIPSELSHVSCSVKTLRGKIVSNWMQSGDMLELEVFIPVNASARLVIPAVSINSGLQITAGGTRISCHTEKLIDACEECFAVDIGSGLYRFKVMEPAI